MTAALLAWLAAAGAAAAAPEAVPQLGHALPVEAVALSPDGRLLATGGRDGKLKLWESSSAHLLRTIEADRLGVTALAFAPGGRSLLTGGAGVALLWDAVTGKALRRFGAPGEFLRFVAFTPDGRRVLAAGDGSAARVWDAATGRKLRAFDTGGPRISAAALSADGRLLAAAAGPRVWVWDLAAGSLTRSFEREGAWTALAFSPDGRTLAAGSEDAALLWDLAAAKERLAFKSAAGRAVAFAKGGRLLTCGGSNTARLWDAKTGEPVRAFIGHLDAVRALAVGGPSARLATGSDDHSARLWDLGTGKTLRVFAGGPRRVLYAALARDGRALLTVDPREARLWDLASGKPVAVSTGDWEGATHWESSRDGRVLAWIQGPETVRLRELGRGPEPPESPWALLKAHALALDQEGLALFGAGPSGVKAWEVPSARELPARSLPGLSALGVWASPGGARLAALEEDGRLGLWEGGRRLARFGLERCLRPEVVAARGSDLVALGGFSRRSAAGPARYRIALHSLADGAELKGWDTGAEMRPFAFGPNDETLIAQGEAGVWTWELASGRKIGAFSLPPGLSLDWPRGVDPRGRYLLADDAGAVVFLAYPGGRELGRLELGDKGWHATGPRGLWDGAGDALRWTQGLSSHPYQRFAAEKRSPGLLSRLAGGAPEGLK